MPRTGFDKARKAISKKKGALDSLHQYSRDSKRLHRAQLRDDKIEKIAASRRKADQPYLERAVFFQEAARQNGSRPLDQGTIQELIKTFVHQYDAELDELKKARRPGRPPSTKENLLKVKISALEKEQRDGFLIPVLDTEEGTIALARWEGHWPYLSTMRWIKLSPDGQSQPSSFPPKGAH